VPAATAKDVCTTVVCQRLSIAIYFGAKLLGMYMRISITLVTAIQNSISGKNLSATEMSIRFNCCKGKFVLTLEALEPVLLA
jgi:hypothetical protein